VSFILYPGNGALICGVCRIWWKKRKDREMQYNRVDNFHDDGGDTARLWPAQSQSQSQRYSDYHAEELPAHHTEAKGMGAAHDVDGKTLDSP